MLGGTATKRSRFDLLRAVLCRDDGVAMRRTARSDPRRLRLDAGDRLRAWSMEEGLTNTYAIDCGRRDHPAVIGTVPARGRTPAGLAYEISPGCARVTFANPRSRWRSGYRPILAFSGEVAAPGKYPLRSQL